LIKFGPERCLLLFGITGESRFSSKVRKRANSIIRSHGGLYTGTLIGTMWQKGRFLTPYLRNTLWDLGYAVDTLETAVTWSQVIQTKSAIVEALSKVGEERDQGVLAFAHLSHVYTDGASIYVTFLFRRLVDPEETLERWREMKREASRVILEHQGTISHQHGIGLDHLPYMAKEKGVIGLNMLKAIQRFVDPDQIMNPGKLLPDDSDSGFNASEYVGPGLA
jgi:alkyldihydroxyacetonephosphate synthase